MTPTAMLDHEEASQSAGSSVRSRWTTWRSKRHGHGNSTQEDVDDGLWDTNDDGFLLDGATSSKTASQPNLSSIFSSSQLDNALDGFSRPQGPQQRASDSSSGSGGPSHDSSSRPTSYTSSAFSPIFQGGATEVGPFGSGGLVQASPRLGGHDVRLMKLSSPSSRSNSTRTSPQTPNFTFRPVEGEEGQSAYYSVETDLQEHLRSSMDSAARRGPRHAEIGRKDATISRQTSSSSLKYADRGAYPRTPSNASVIGADADAGVFSNVPVSMASPSRDYAFPGTSSNIFASSPRVGSQASRWEPPSPRTTVVPLDAALGHQSNPGSPAGSLAKRRFGRREKRPPGSPVLQKGENTVANLVSDSFIRQPSFETLGPSAVKGTELPPLSGTRRTSVVKGTLVSGLRKFMQGSHSPSASTEMTSKQMSRASSKASMSQRASADQLGRRPSHAQLEETAERAATPQEDDIRLVNHASALSGWQQTSIEEAATPNRAALAPERTLYELPAAAALRNALAHRPSTAPSQQVGLPKKDHSTSTQADGTVLLHATDGQARRPTNPRQPSAPTAAEAALSDSGWVSSSLIERKASVEGVAAGMPKSPVVEHSSATGDAGRASKTAPSRASVIDALYDETRRRGVFTGPSLVIPPHSRTLGDGIEELELEPHTAPAGNIVPSRPSRTEKSRPGSAQTGVNSLEPSDIAASFNAAHTKRWSGALPQAGVAQSLGVRRGSIASFVSRRGSDAPFFNRASLYSGGAEDVRSGLQGAKHFGNASVDDFRLSGTDHLKDRRGSISRLGSSDGQPAPRPARRSFVGQGSKRWSGLAFGAGKPSKVDLSTISRPTSVASSAFSDAAADMLTDKSPRTPTTPGLRAAVAAGELDTEAVVRRMQRNSDQARRRHSPSEAQNKSVLEGAPARTDLEGSRPKTSNAQQSTQWTAAIDRRPMSTASDALRRPSTSDAVPVNGARSPLLQHLHASHFQTLQSRSTPSSTSHSSPAGAHSTPIRVNSARPGSGDTVASKSSGIRRPAGFDDAAFDATAAFESIPSPLPPADFPRPDVASRSGGQEGSADLLNAAAAAASTEPQTATAADGFKERKSASLAPPYELEPGPESPADPHLSFDSSGSGSDDAISEARVSLHLDRELAVSPRPPPLDAPCSPGTDADESEMELLSDSHFVFGDDQERLRKRSTESLRDLAAPRSRPTIPRRSSSSSLGGRSPPRAAPRPSSAASHALALPRSARSSFDSVHSVLSGAIESAATPPAPHIATTAGDRRSYAFV